jgi:hypothetical protein
MSATSTTHPVSPEELMALLDGELPADRAQSVSAHLASCLECQKGATSLRAGSTILASWTVSPAPADLPFESRLLEKSRDAAPQTGVVHGFGPLIYQHWRIVASTVCAGILLMSSALFFRPARLTKSETLLSFKDKGRNPVSVDQSRVNSRVPPRREPPSGVNVPLGSPAAVDDSNGLLRGRGDHAQDAFSIDGQPPVDKQAKEQLKEQLGDASSYQHWLQSGPMIARSISLAIVAKDFTAARVSLDAILARHNGYAANLSVSTPEGAARSLQASLRIPAPQLAAALTELKSLGRVENESQSGEEVTQQHADLVARLKNSRETEERLQAILVQRTGKISDVLAVEQEIARVRGEIEQMEAEQKNLEHRVDFGAVELRIDEEYKAQLNSPAPSVSTLFHNAGVSGLRALADSLLSVVLFFAEYGPVLIFWIFFFFIPAWFVWRRWRHALSTI